MRDLLDNLIDRHMNAAPEIMPRLPSIFEPETSHSGFDLTVKEEATTPEAMGTLWQPPRAAQPVGQPTIAEPVRSIISPDPTAPIEHEQSTATPRPQPSATTGAPVTARVHRAQLGEQIEPVHSPLKTASREHSSISSPPREAVRSPSQPAVTPTVPVIRRVRRADQEERMSHISPTIKTTAEARSSVSLSPRDMPPLLSSAQKNAQDSMHKPNEGLLTPSAPLTALRPPIAESGRSISRPDPVINVTIGRIEVRATVSPQKQTAKPESRAPVMSLEEYLRRRSGGHDR